jgi:sugar/nucleoside kinase (ribokinase family)
MSHVMKLSAEDVDFLYRGADPKTLAAQWIRAGARLVVLTRGEFGVSAWTRGVHVQLPAERVTVVDTVGAGDAFQAALLAGLAETAALSPEAIAELDEPALSRLLAFAIRAAAITCSRRGADPLVAPSFRRYMAANPLASNMAVPLCPLGRLLGAIRSSPTGIAAVDNHDAARHKACRV